MLPLHHYRSNMKKYLIIALVAIVVANANAQVIPLKNPLKSTINGIDVYPLADTVTNTATAYLTNRVAVTGRGVGVTVEVIVTKISGTVGGTISLLVSNDGTNFKAITTEETATALATYTAADASGMYSWRLNKVPYRWYRVSWTGTGTMSASFKADVYKIR